MKRVLVTGANGFVGQHLVSLLAKNNYTIIGLVNKADKALPKNNNVEYESGDIADKEFMSAIIQKTKPEAIVHLAAKTHTWFADTADIFRVNVDGTINLYDAVINVRQTCSYNPKIIYVSSSEIYGKVKRNTKILENNSFYPLNPYAASKVSGDRLSYSYSQSQKINIVIARPFTHTGPGQAKGFFVPDMCSQIVDIEKNTDKPLMVGNLEAIRDYLDVRDVVKAYRLILEADIEPGEALNICSGQGIKIADLLAKLIKISQAKIRTEQDLSRMRPADAPFYVGDSSRLKKLTGWAPAIDLDDTLSQTLDYWRNQVS